MADKKDNNKPLLPTKPPRGNYQIWVILATVAVIIGVMYFNNSNNLKEIDYDTFKQMVSSGDVKKVVLVQNRKFVEITLKPEALQNAKYKQDLNIGESPTWWWKCFWSSFFNESSRRGQLRSRVPNTAR